MGKFAKFETNLKTELPLLNIHKATLIQYSNISNL